MRLSFFFGGGGAAYFREGLFIYFVLFCFVSFRCISLLLLLLLSLFYFYLFIFFLGGGRGLFSGGLIYLFCFVSFRCISLLLLLSLFYFYLFIYFFFGGGGRLLSEFYGTLAPEEIPWLLNGPVRIFDVISQMLYRLCSYSPRSKNSISQISDANILPTIIPPEYNPTDCYF